MNKANDDNLSYAHSEALIRHHILVVKTYLNHYPKCRSTMRIPPQKVHRSIEWLEQYFKID